MNRLKLIFSQTLMISTGILFGLGIQGMIDMVAHEDVTIVWEWYIPFSIIFTGFLCSIPSVIFLDDEGIAKLKFSIKVTIHFLAMLGVVSICGKLFGWYTELREYLYILAMYVVIYFFVVIHIFEYHPV